MTNTSTRPVTGRTIALAALLLLAPVAGAVGLSGPASAAAPTDCRDNGYDDPRITGTATLDSDGLTEQVTLTYDLSNGPQDFEVVLQGFSSIESLEGFNKSGVDGTLEWDGETTTASITYTAISASDSDYDNGIFVTPTYKGVADDEVRLRADGPGIVSRDMMHLGTAYTVETVEYGCETIRLVVPCGVSVEATRDEVLESLRSASEDLRIGNRWGTVTVFAAEDVRYFGVIGAYFGEGDMVVEADMPVDDAGNTWVHEYVHSRQAFGSAASSQWLVEASAEYYAARLTYKQDRIDAEEYADTVGYVGVEPSELSNKSDWSSSMVPYDQGSYVLAGLDTRIRAAGDESLQTVLREVNDRARGDGTVNNTEVRRIVRTESNQTTAEWYGTYSTTGQLPDVDPLGGPNGLSRRETGLLASLQASLGGTFDGLGEWASNLFSPPEDCSRGGYVI